LPRNRRDIPREERLSALLDVAQRLFVDRTFDAVTMAEIARQSGVKSGAVYWYFPTKDHVLAAVMERASAALWRGLDELPADVAPADRLVYFLTSLRPLRSIHVAMHSRMARSDVVADAHLVLMSRFRELAMSALDMSDGEFDRSLAVEALCAAFEGANMDPDLERSGTEIVQFLLTRVLLRQGREAPRHM
jgi:TetR/AcrR family transcriptional repressor of mexAB-oprM operon